ncbi:MAG: DUF2520 domain-containing protein [Saprospiraceae bacterium]|nr:DUF2520 domain-containing protein [Saprospiraceae bacterium]
MIKCGLICIWHPYLPIILQTTIYWQLKILDKAQIPFEVLHSLMLETVDKAFRLDPINAQTGPAKRGDVNTIEKHIRLLVSEFPEYRSLYKNIRKL